MGKTDLGLTQHQETDYRAKSGQSTISDDATIRNTEIENSIVVEDAQIDCGRRITDSLIGRKVTILSHEQNVQKGHRLIIGDMATVTL